MEEPKNKKEPKKVQVKMKLKTLIIIIAIIVVLLAGNVFAGVMGYGNLFFMIKNLVTTGSVEGKDNLLEDREITISYSNINIASGIELQVNTMKITKEKSTLDIHLKNKAKKDLSFELFDSNNKSIGETKFKSESESDDCDLSIVTNENVKEDDILTLKVFDITKDEKILRTITIDLGKREITVEGEDAVKKVSEVELKKYLSEFALLNYANDLNDEEVLNDYTFIVANRIASNVLEIYELDREATNDLVDSFYGDFVTKETVKGKEILKTGAGYEYSAESDEYKATTDECEVPETKCIKINDMSYSDGTYKIKYVYMLTEYPATVAIQSYYESTIEVKLDEDSKYSKYQIVKMGKAKEIEDDATIKEEKTTFEDDAGLEYNKNLKADENGKIALAKLGVDAFKTEKKKGYYVYEDGFGNKYEFTDIINVDSEFYLMSIDEECALFKCSVTYNTVKEGQKMFEVAVALDDDFKYANILGTFDNYTGSTHFVRNFTNLYAEEEEETENCNHEFECQKVVYSSQEHLLTLDGTHNCICVKCGESKKEKHHFGKWFSIYDNTAWTLWCDDCKGYVYTTDYNVVKKSGYDLYEDESKKCEHNYECQVVDYSGNVKHAELDGTHNLVCTKCGDTKEEKHNFGKWYSIYNNTAWTLWCDDCKQYIYTEDYNFVKKSGYDLQESSKVDKVKIELDEDGDTYNITFMLNGYEQTKEIKCSKSIIEKEGSTFASRIKDTTNNKEYSFCGGIANGNGKMHFRVGTSIITGFDKTGEFSRHYCIEFNGPGTYELQIAQ